MKVNDGMRAAVAALAPAVLFLLILPALRAKVDCNDSFFGCGSDDDHVVLSLIARCVPLVPLTCWTLWLSLGAQARAEEVIDDHAGTPTAARARRVLTLTRAAFVAVAAAWIITLVLYNLGR